jgi:hypothetical protein
MDKAATDGIVTIVQLLAKSADDSRLSPMQVHVLNQNVEALLKHDSDEFVRTFLGMVKEAHGVLTPNVVQKLAGGIYRPGPRGTQLTLRSVARHRR